MTCKTQEVFYKAMVETDGMICISVPELDGTSIETMSRYQGVPYFGIG